MNQGALNSKKTSPANWPATKCYVQGGRGWARHIRSIHHRTEWIALTG